MRYSTDTLSRREMRCCFSRFCITMILYLVVMKAVVQGMAYVAVEFLPQYVNSPRWYPVMQILINDMGVYIPGLTLVPLLLHRLPRAPKMQVNRLSLWELFQGIVFTMGAAYIASGITSGIVEWLENFAGAESENILDGFTSAMPGWLSFAAIVVVGPILEEVIFRKIMFEPMRALGDIPAVLMTALSFALFHMNLYQMLYAFTAGLIFGSVVLLTGSIRDAILLHMAINGFSQLHQLSDALEYQLFLGLVVTGCILTVPFFLARSVGRYHFEPGPLHFHSREKLRACFTSVWFWLLLVVGIGGSIVRIFQ